MSDNERWVWCAACGAWRRVIEGSQIGGRCKTCGSGRVRPPAAGEKPPEPATRPPGEGPNVLSPFGV